MDNIKIKGKLVTINVISPILSHAEISLSLYELSKRLTDDEIVFLKQALQEEWERRVING